MCFAKCEKLIVFGALFGANFGWCSKISIKYVFQHVFKSKTWQNMTIFKRHYLGQVKGYYLGQVGVQKNNLAHTITIKNCVRTCFQQKSAEPLFYSVFDKHCVFKKQLSGPSWPFLCCNKLGPDNNPYLAQIITLQNGHFFFFCFWKCAEIPIFIVFFWTSTKIWPKKGQKKTITFHILQNTGY